VTVSRLHIDMQREKHTHIDPGPLASRKLSKGRRAGQD
jgi:hypothetical protein